MMSASVRVEGADQALKALRVMEPETAKQVGREVSAIGARIAGGARALAPSGPPVSGWYASPGWHAWTPVTATSARRGMSVRIRLTSANPIITSMAESMGKGTRITTTKGAVLSRMAAERWSPIVQSGKKSGRAARAAVSAEYPAAMQGIRDAVDRAVAAVNRRMP